MVDLRMSKGKGKEEEANFQIRPPFSKKFKPGAVKVGRLFQFKTIHSLSTSMSYSAVSKDFEQEIIHAALNDQLGGKVYDANKVSQWSKNIADNVKSQVKTLGYDRYKIVVEVVIGEQRGEGVRMGSRCLISFQRFGKLFSEPRMYLVISRVS